MSYKRLFLLLLLLKAFPCFAFGSDTLKIFFDINKYDLSPADKVNINTLLASVGTTDTVKIFGYADYLGNDDDNALLSLNRARAIKDYLLTLNKDFMMITAGKGALPAIQKRSAYGDPNSRRVDVIKVKSEGRFIPLNAAKSKSPAPGGARRVSPGPEDKRSFQEKISDLANLKPGGSLSLPEITFQPGRHFLNNEARPLVDTLLKYLRKHSNLVFEIRGHICCVLNDGDSYDPDARSFVLSANRAKYIYDYFVQNGISPARMTYKGLGSSDPKVWPEYSEYDRATNRRVEIVIINK